MLIFDKIIGNNYKGNKNIKNIPILKLIAESLFCKLHFKYIVFLLQFIK